jgi:DNA replication protein DnaC
MSLQKKIIVNTHYTRSVNMERDAGSLAVVEAYIPTSRALRTLERVVASFGEHQAPRAWSLVGPYGSGKSSFAVFLSHLLSDSRDTTTKAAHAVLARTEPSLAKKISGEIDKSNGYCKVVLTGSPAHRHPLSHV